MCSQHFCWYQLPITIEQLAGSEDDHGPPLQIACRCVSSPTPSLPHSLLPHSLLSSCALSLYVFLFLLCFPSLSPISLSRLPSQFPVFHGSLLLPPPLTLALTLAFEVSLSKTCSPACFLSRSEYAAQRSCMYICKMKPQSHFRALSV